MTIHIYIYICLYYILGVWMSIWLPGLVLGYLDLYFVYLDLYLNALDLYFSVWTCILVSGLVFVVSEFVYWGVWTRGRPSFLRPLWMMG